MARGIFRSALAATVLGGGLLGMSGLPTTPAAALVEAGPAIGLAKGAGEITEVQQPFGPSAGDTIDYTFTVTNTGDVPVTDVAISDPQVGAVDCPAEEVAPGDSVDCTAAPYPLTQADVEAGAVENTAMATATASEGADPAPAEASISTPVASMPGIGLVKVHQNFVDKADPEGISAGDVVPYSFVVTNTGNRVLTQIEVTDDLLAEAVTCPSTELNPTARVTCTGNYTLTAEDMEGSELLNIAGASGMPAANQAEPEPSAVTAEGQDRLELPAGPSFSLDKIATPGNDADGDGRIEVGDEIDYTFEVTNTGGVTLSDVTINDDLVSNVVCQPATVVAGDSTFCTADPYVVTAADVQAGSVDNIATATAITPAEEELTSEPDTTATVVEDDTNDPQVLPSDGAKGNGSQGSGTGTNNGWSGSSGTTAEALPDTGGFEAGYLFAGFGMAIVGAGLLLRERRRRGMASA